MKTVEKGRGMRGMWRMMMIGRNIEREIAMIVIGSSAWIIICQFAEGHAWRMCLLRVFVSLPAMYGKTGASGNGMDKQIDWVM